MTTVSPWRALQPLVYTLVYSSFTNQIDQIARPAEEAARLRNSRGTVRAAAAAAAAATRHFGPRADTRRVCLLGYRFSFGKHFRFYSPTCISYYLSVCLCVCVCARAPLWRVQKHFTFKFPTSVSDDRVGRAPILTYFLMFVFRIILTPPRECKPNNQIKIVQKNKKIPGKNTIQFVRHPTFSSVSL